MASCLLHATATTHRKRRTSAWELTTSPRFRSISCLPEPLFSAGELKKYGNVADSKVAEVKISKDTLRISGIWEGRTYATIISGDFKKRVEINVVVPELSISQSEIRLYPRDESKFVSLNGGGDIVDLKIEDSDKVINAKWNAKTNILEIQAYYEGEAMIRVISQDKKEKTLKVVVRCDGTAGRVGIYGTTSLQSLRADEHGDGRAASRCGSVALQRCAPIFFPEGFEDNTCRCQSPWLEHILMSRSRCFILMSSQVAD